MGKKTQKMGPVYKLVVHLCYIYSFSMLLKCSFPVNYGINLSPPNLTRYTQILQTTLMYKADTFYFYYVFWSVVRHKSFWVFYSFLRVGKSGLHTKNKRPKEFESIKIKWDPLLHFSVSQKWHHHVNILVLRFYKGLYVTHASATKLFFYQNLKLWFQTFVQ